MRIAALVLLGVISLERLPVDLLPNVSIPIVAVVTSWPNVAPEVIEAQVTRPIEESVSSATNLYQVDSSTTEGTSFVRVQFQWGTDIGQAAVDVLQLVERARQSFPTDPTLQTPIVFKFDPTQLPIIIFGVSGEQDRVKLRTLLDNEISPIVESANGVAAAIATGGEQRAIIVDVDPDRMRAHNVTLAEIIRRIAEENVNLPAGIAKQGKTEYTIRSLGWFTSPEEMTRIPVAQVSGENVYLGQVASVRDEHPETRVYTRFNTKPSAGLIVIKQSGANTVTTAQNVVQKVDLIRRLYPDLKFGLAYDQSAFISQSVNDVKTNALIGAVLAVLILLFFLRNVRSTLVVALSIPTSIISTFALLYMGGFTINTMSLGGLALATGLIVDDAVVVLENIFRHFERGEKDVTQAAVNATNEIVSAVMASTWTVMVVFLPLFLIKGQAGQMFTQFALVVIFSLAVSLLDATTVVPMLATRLLRGEAHVEETVASERATGFGQRVFARFKVMFDSLDSAYRRGLEWALGHRWPTVAGALGITAASLLLVPEIGTELMPPTDSGDFQIQVKMPVGTALSETDATMQQIERIVVAHPDVETAFAAAGSTLTLRGTTTALIPYQGSVQVKLKDNRRKSTLQVIAELRRRLSRLPGAQARLFQFDLVTNLMTGGNPNVEVDIFGNELGTLSASAQGVLQRVGGIRGYENLDVNWQEAMPEIRWQVDRAEAEQLGVSFSDVANTLNTASNGSIASYYQERGFQYPIIVQMPEATRKTVPELRDLIVNPGALSSAQVVAGTPAGGAAAGASTGSQQAVLLRQVAQPVYTFGPSQITRLNRQRYIAVTGTPQGRSPGDIQGDIRKALRGFHLPAGYYWDWGTDQRRRADEFGNLGLAIMLAIGLIYMLLASQFESLIYPLIILLSVPLAATGVILALFLTGRSFGLTAFVGLLMLVGIVVKNGILLVDYTNVLRRRGMPRDEAVLTAGPTRMRPILMTASAAILGMLPLALALGRGSEVQAPMATAVIGGLATSTFLTLFVVPTVYTLFDDLGAKLHAWRTGAGAERKGA